MQMEHLLPRKSITQQDERRNADKGGIPCVVESKLVMPKFVGLIGWPEP